MPDAAALPIGHGRQRLAVTLTTASSHPGSKCDFVLNLDFNGPDRVATGGLGCTRRTLRKLGARQIIVSNPICRRARINHTGRDVSKRLAHENRSGLPGMGSSAHAQLVRVAGVRPYRAVNSPSGCHPASRSSHQRDWRAKHRAFGDPCFGKDGQRSVSIPR